MSLISAHYLNNKENMEDISDWLGSFHQLNPDAVAVVEEVTKKKESTLSLQQELPAMDYGDKNFYKNLSDEHKKEISIWLLMRYMSSSNSAAEHHLMMVNDLVNQNFTSLTKHPELQWLLLTLCATHKKQFHPWIPPPKGAKKNKIEEALIQFFPLMKDDDLELMMKINSQADLESFFKENGFDDKTVKDIFKK